MKRATPPNPNPKSTLHPISHRATTTTALTTMVMPTTTTMSAAIRGGRGFRTVRSSAVGALMVLLVLRAVSTRMMMMMFSGDTIGEVGGAIHPVCDLRRNRSSSSRRRSEQELARGRAGFEIAADLRGGETHGAVADRTATVTRRSKRSRSSTTASGVGQGILHDLATRGCDPGRHQLRRDADDVVGPVFGPDVAQHAQVQRQRAGDVIRSDGVRETLLPVARVGAGFEVDESIVVTTAADAVGTTTTTTVIDTTRVDPVAAVAVVVAIVAQSRRGTVPVQVRITAIHHRSAVSTTTFAHPAPAGAAAARKAAAATTAAAAVAVGGGISVSATGIHGLLDIGGRE